MYGINFVQEAVQELRTIRAKERRRILDEIERQLRREPARGSKRRKMLVGLTPPWDQLRSVWQLRIGDWRVFYDVNQAEERVIVRAVRRKGRKRVEEVL